MFNKKLLILTVVVLILTYFVFKGIKQKINTMNLQQAFDKLKTYGYSPETIKVTEQIMRLETNHFKSSGYQRTFGAGMEKFDEKFPYGWSSLTSFWQQSPEFAPIGFYTTPENQTGKIKTFLEFPTIFAGIITLAQVMKNRGNNAGSWYSRDKNLQASYNAKIAKITTIFI